MQIEILGGFGGQSPECRMTCVLINGTIALDAGSLAQSLSVERQAQVRSIVLTHSHVDHTSSLPFFVENIFGRGEPIDIHASHSTIYALRKNLFNNAAWPDFTRLPNSLLPSIQFHELSEESPVTIDGVKFTPITMDHLIPTYGFLIEHGGKAVLWSSDTGPTVRFWEIANRTPHLLALFVETSFDNSLQQIADMSGHLTPRSLAAELRKLERGLPVLIQHMKPPCVEKIRAEIAELDNPQIGFAEQGKVYRF